MSGVSLPVTRPVGRALLVGSATCRAQSLTTLQGLGYSCAEADDPYAAMAELCRRPVLYRALILSISSLYREELHLIQSVKQRLPHIEIWLADTDGRQSALADGMRLGADGLLAEDGLHRIAVAPSVEHAPLSAFSHDSERETSVGSDEADERRVSSSTTTSTALSDVGPRRAEPDPGFGEPVLSAEELRALLQEQPATPPNGDGGERGA